MEFASRRVPNSLVNAFEDIEVQIVASGHAQKVAPGLMRHTKQTRLMHRQNAPTEEFATRNQAIAYATQISKELLANARNAPTQCEECATAKESA